MKIMIAINNGFLGIPAGDHCGAILSALSDAHEYENTWGNPKFKLKGTKERPASLEIVLAQEGAFEAPTPLEVALDEAAKKAQADWLTQYEKAQAAELRIKELEGEIEELKARKGKADEVHQPE